MNFRTKESERMTAWGWEQENRKNPGYMKQREEREAAFQARVALASQRSAPIRAELKELGVQVDSIAELFNYSIDYRKCLPVLLKWLPLAQDAGLKESIIRALTVRWARPQAAIPLIQEWKKIEPCKEGPTFHLKWAIGNALETVADDSVFDDLVVMLRDKRDGRAREMIARCLWRMKNPQVLDLLIDLLDDEDVAPEALYSLRRLKGKALEARGKVEPLVNHPNRWIREEAKKTLASFDKVK